MMNTPICDFVRSYARTNVLRLHMPGHKGVGVLGVEKLDITEIEGADSLYEASGVIRESEENASQLFGCPTFYSTEGSSLCIRAMMYLIRLQAGEKPLIWAGRNAHKTFLSAAALLDLDVEWLYPRETGSHLCCLVDAQEILLVHAIHGILVLLDELDCCAIQPEGAQCLNQQRVHSLLLSRAARAATMPSTAAERMPPA